MDDGGTSAKLDATQLLYQPFVYALFAHGALRSSVTNGDWLWSFTSHLLILPYRGSDIVPETR